MKALVYTGPEVLSFTDAPLPRPAAGEALVRVEQAGICGSDMHAYLGHDDRRPAPLILGHEAAGTVIEGPLSGRRVVVNPLVTCGSCDTCRAGRANICRDRQIISMPPRAGAFAQYLALPAANLIPVPDRVPLEKAALCEPLACGWHAVRLASRLLAAPIEGQSCLVIGGGAIGLGAALCLAARGVARIAIAENNPARHGALAAAGNFSVVHPGDVRDGAHGLVIDGVGLEPTRRLAGAAVESGGVIVHIGLGSAAGGLDVRRMTLQEITLVGSYTYAPHDFHSTAMALFDGSLGALDWAELRPLADGARAFADIRSGAVAAPKIMLTP